jgi:hypothetical protein
MVWGASGLTATRVSPVLIDPMRCDRRFARSGFALFRRPIGQGACWPGLEGRASPLWPLFQPAAVLARSAMTDRPLLAPPEMPKEGRFG